MKTHELISIVVPFYNEEQVVDECHRRLTAVLGGIGCDYELVFVNDGSRDETPAMLNRIQDSDSHVRVVHLVRNFGHQNAITAGMEVSRGDAIIVIDADLQDPPELIPAMLERWREGWDVVYAKRSKRAGESLFKRVSASLFYRLIDKLSDVRLPVDVGDYRLIDRRVLEVLRTLPEHNRYVRGLIAWLGFRQTEVLFERAARFAGETKYPLSKMVKFATDGLTGFSTKPLQLSSIIGFAAMLLGFAALVWVFIVKFVANQAIDGWASLIGVNLVFFGLLFLVQGIQGTYIGRLYEEAKRRPLYVIDEKRSRL